MSVESYATDSDRSYAAGPERGKAESERRKARCVSTSEAASLSVLTRRHGRRADKRSP
jgi:hypothetical protein